MLWRNFSSVPVDWPFGAFFQPEALSCLPAPPGEGSPLVFWSAFFAYEELGPRSGRPLALRRLSRSAFPAGSAVLCTPPAPPPNAVASAAPGRCLVAMPVQTGIDFWPYGSSLTDAKVHLPLHGRPWRRLAGASVRCGALAPLLPPKSPLVADGGEDWCLLLAGWDGLRVPLAVLPLPDGPGAPPAAAGSIVLRADAPLTLRGSSTCSSRHVPAPAEEAADEADEVLALSLEPASGRLWALLAGSDIQAWEVLRLRSLGRWRLELPGKGSGFSATALCEDPGSGALYVAGSGGLEGPELVRGSVPSMLDDRAAPGPEG